MKVRIGDQIFDSEMQPIALIFDTDADRKQMADQLTHMKDKEGVRIYAQFPAAQADNLEIVSGYMQQTLVILMYSHELNTKA